MLLSLISWLFMFMATALWGVHSTLAAAPLFGFSIIFGMWNDKYIHLRVLQILAVQLVGLVVTTILSCKPTTI